MFHDAVLEGVVRHYHDSPTDRESVEDHIHAFSNSCEFIIDLDP